MTRATPNNSRASAPRRASKENTASPATFAPAAFPTATFPLLSKRSPRLPTKPPWSASASSASCGRTAAKSRSEEHTSELQSHSDLVCRLLLEKKKKKTKKKVNKNNHTIKKESMQTKRRVNVEE